MKSIATITCFSSKINNFKNICFFYFWNIGGAAESVNFAAPPIFQRLGHLLLLHLFVDDVPGGQLVPDLLQADAQLEHEDHHVVGQVGDLVDGLLLVLGLAGDDVHRADVDIRDRRREEDVYSLGESRFDLSGFDLLWPVLHGLRRSVCCPDCGDDQGQINKVSFHFTAVLKSIIADGWL